MFSQKKMFWEFSLLPAQFPLLIFLAIFPEFVDSIRCFECSSGPNDWTCNRYVGASCGYGFFGCIKVATYDGGVDKLGNFINDPRAIVSLIRGCNLLPLGGVDACQQQILLGYRVITCYCYSDYCNGTIKRWKTNSPALLFSYLLILSAILFPIIFI